MLKNILNIGRKLINRVVNILIVKLDDEENEILESITNYLNYIYDTDYTSEELYNNFDLDGKLNIYNETVENDRDFEVYVDIKELRLYKYVDYECVEIVEFEDKETMKLFFDIADLSDITFSNEYLRIVNDDKYLYIYN